MDKDCDAVVVDAHGVVVGFFGEFGVRVLLYAFYERGGGKWEIAYFEGFDGCGSRGRGLDE